MTAKHVPLSASALGQISKNALPHPLGAPIPVLPNSPYAYNSKRASRGIYGSRRTWQEDSTEALMSKNEVTGGGSNITAKQVRLLLNTEDTGEEVKKEGRGKREDGDDNRDLPGITLKCV
ncbi:hypothetical protein Tco_1148852 [Tanacetum coccineum]